MGNFYITLDTETTGLNAGYHGLLQIGAVATNDNGEVLDVFKEYCDPCLPEERYSPEAMKVNGIPRDVIEMADADISVCYALSQWMDKFRGEKLPDRIANQRTPDYTHNIYTVFHNAPFDVSFLKFTFVESAIPTDYFRRPLDTISLGYAAFGEVLSLKNLGEKLGLGEQMGAHDALADALYTSRAFHRLQTKLVEMRAPVKPVVISWRLTDNFPLAGGYAPYVPPLNLPFPNLCAAPGQSW